MANQHKHRLRGIRGIPDADWDEFGANTARAGTDRSSEVLAFIRRYNQAAAGQGPGHDARSDDSPDHTTS